jgi:hypothetical protein
LDAFTERFDLTAFKIICEPPTGSNACSNLNHKLRCRIIFFKAHTQAATFFQMAGEKLTLECRRDGLQ